MNVNVTCGSSTVVDEDANCLAGDIVGALVYVTGPAVSGRMQVATADPDNLSKMPAIGMLITKTSPTDCKVRLFGLTTVGGLTPNERYFVGPGGTYVTPAGLSATRPMYSQSIGQAADATRLMLEFSKDIIRIRV